MLLLFCLVCNWSVGRFVVVVPRAALLEQISKSDTVARPRLLSFALVGSVKEAVNENRQEGEVL